MSRTRVGGGGDTQIEALITRSIGGLQHRKELPMWDLGCIAASIAFFSIATLYLFGCGRLDFTERK